MNSTRCVLMDYALECYSVGYEHVISCYKRHNNDCYEICVVMRCHCASNLAWDVKNELRLYLVGREWVNLWEIRMGSLCATRSSVGLMLILRCDMYHNIWVLSNKSFFFQNQALPKHSQNQLNHTFSLFRVEYP